MVKVVITNELKSYEADIRDLCLAFFPYQKVEIEPNLFIENSEDILIENFFYGTLTGDRTIDKSEIKRQLYDYLKEKTGKELLWGTLTGIRPVTIVTNMIENAKPEEKPSKSIGKTLGLSPITEIENPKYKLNESIHEELKKEYYISDEKANLLIEIANREINILGRDNIKNYKDRYSIYIGVPFCKSTCLYCSFTSFNIERYRDYVDKYLDTLESELKNRMHEISSSETSVYKPMTLYIGGGTPTSLDVKSFERLLNIVDKYIDLSTSVEYTIEAGRPDTIDIEKLKLMKDHKVNRISINPQTFNQKTLDLIGRKHTVKDIIEKFDLARKLSFDNINMDIIMGLPNERKLQVMNTLFNIYKLRPDSVTVHMLALKRAARLNNELESWTKDYYLAGLSESNVTEGKRTIDKMEKYSKTLMECLDLKPYYLYRQKNIAGNLENVGYAKAFKESIYNIMMMSERHSVYGFGTATTKKVFYENNSKRIENELGFKSVADYILTKNT